LAVSRPPGIRRSFVTANLVNYLLCRAFVFRSGRFSRPEEVSRLFVIAVVGLGLNSAAVWLLAGVLGVDPTLAKILAVFPVFAWNYLGRRSIVFASGPSAAVALLSERLRVKP
jgi:putative flippase GtrA